MEVNQILTTYIPETYLFCYASSNIDYLTFRYLIRMKFFEVHFFYSINLIILIIITFNHYMNLNG